MPYADVCFGTLQPYCENSSIVMSYLVLEAAMAGTIPNWQAMLYTSSTLIFQKSEVVHYQKQNALSND